MTLIESFRSRMERRARFRHTVYELEAMGAEVQRDLNIAPADIRRIARHAVYG